MNRFHHSARIGTKISLEPVCRSSNRYNDRLSQLTEEIKTKGGSMSPIEQFLMDKFNAEIGYCNIALLKAGIGISEELKGFVEIGKKHIQKYENELLTQHKYDNKVYL